MGVNISLVRVARVIFEARDDKSPLLFLVKKSWLHINGQRYMESRYGLLSHKDNKPCDLGCLSNRPAYIHVVSSAHQGFLGSQMLSFLLMQGFL